MVHASGHRGLTRTIPGGAVVLTLVRSVRSAWRGSIRRICQYAFTVVKQERLYWYRVLYLYVMCTGNVFSFYKKSHLLPGIGIQL